MLPVPSHPSPEQVLAGAEEGVRVARAVEVDQLRLLLAWADIHSGDPQNEPNAIPVKDGGPQLVHLGGDGTPGVVDLALPEIAIARHESAFATRSALADALDLRHRLPTTWENLQHGTCPVWVGRKIAALSRKLDKTQVQLLDHALVDALAQAPGRILALTEAKIIEADPATHQQRIKQNQERKGVWYPTPRPGDLINSDAAGTGTVIARLDHADALPHQQAINDLATALATHAPAPASLPARSEAPLPMDHWRAGDCTVNGVTPETGVTRDDGTERA
ncbi:MAG: hypothetical protein L0H31_05515 [Nocardioidaceae bacterium]|nr:hypothetical protein [Nocardioidaceae bacterium]